jgi:redox-sensitive bicupin YhaK (pirin superfamily)
MVGDGFRVHNFIPSYPALSMEKMNPFIMLDYASRYYFPPSSKPRGVDVHPHRGFETVTIAYKGKIAHHDSAGNSGVIGEGDVQWMTAASGVLHKEYHEAQFSKSGGDFQMVQLWVNLPARMKMSKPKYQEITRAKMGRYQLPDAAGTVEVIAGNYRDVEGPASTFTPIHLMNAKLEAGGEAEFSFPAHYRTAILVIEGGVQINQQSKVAVNHMALLGNDGESFTIKADDKSIVLVMSAEPLNEPIAAHGPFVMNTRSEIMQAFADYQTGKFGRLD